MNDDIPEEHRPSRGIEATDFAPPMRAALIQLLKARDYTRDMQCDPWEFAIEIDHLISLGITTSDLRWLVKKGYVEHACEVTGPADTSRRFEDRNNLAFTKASCFLLADSASATLKNISLAPNADMAASGMSPGRPYWDAEDRTLYWGQQVVKEYRVRSPNQEAVLSAFEEEQWPHYIDDPLSPVGDQNPKQRLRDTIKCLNANQRNHRIRFRGDGTGERVRWELIG